MLHTVAHVYNLTGRHEGALHLCEDGLGLARDLGVRVATADWLGITGDPYYGLGRYHEAAESLRSALPIYRDHFMHRHHALCLLKMGYAYQAVGDYQAAIPHLDESLGIFDKLQLGHFAERARGALDAWLSAHLNAYLRDDDEYRAITRETIIRGLAGTITWTPDAITVRLEQPGAPRIRARVPGLGLSAGRVFDARRALTRSAGRPGHP